MIADQQAFIRRSNFLPRKVSDYPFFLFISCMIPLTYWFEIWVVLPSLFSDYPFTYWTLFIIAHFILHNVVGNFLGIIIFDSSIRGRKMPKETDLTAAYCSICECFTPPRSFHCPSCDICILKRDHHCLFTSCCVGFYNHRFFFLFIVYLVVATAACIPFNLYYLRDTMRASELSFIPALIFPVILFIVDLGTENFEIEHFYLVITVLGVLGFILCSVWSYFHLKLILSGTVVYEMKKHINTYNLGWEGNLQMVFGKHWRKVWMSPYIKSPLLCDGITYPLLQDKEHLNKKD